MNARVRDEAIYEAVFDDAALAVLPAALTETVDGRSAILQWRHLDHCHETIAYSGFSDDFMARYAATFVAIDPWAALASDPPRVNQALRLDQYVPASVFERSRIYNEFVKPQGADTFHCAGVVFQTVWGEGMLGIHRGRRAPAFEDADLAPLEPHLPHLRRMLQVRGELAAHRRGEKVARDALDSVAMGAVVVRAGGHPAHVNASADAVLGRGDGLRISRGRVGCASPVAGARLDAAIAAATARSGAAATAVAVDRRDGRPPYLVSVTPMTGYAGPALALLLFRDPDRAEAALEARLRALFALTRIEAAIAVDLRDGLDAPRIAAKRGVKPSTIKTQIASLSAKMGCARQSQVAARVAGLPPASC